MHEEKGFVRLLYAVSVLQMYGFQVSIDIDTGNLHKVTVYRLVRSEKDTIRMVVFTCLADFPAAYSFVADELAKVCEKFIDREDLRQAVSWVADAEIRHMLAAHVDQIPAAVAGGSESFERMVERAR